MICNPYFYKYYLIVCVVISFFVFVISLIVEYFAFRYFFFML